jgi:PAN domain
MASLLGLLLFLSLSIFSCAQVYNGCDHYAVESIFVPCNRAGVLKNPAPLGPEFPTSPKGAINAFLVCDFACFDNIRCRSFSYRASDRICQLYTKTLQGQNFQEGASARRFYAAGCTGGKDVNFPGRVWAQDRFSPGKTFTITPPNNPQNPNWELETPERCKDTGNALRALPPLAQVISMKRKLNLAQIGATYRVRFDYMYENADPNNIIFGLIFQDDEQGGLDRLFELARSNDPTKEGVWQRKEVEFASFRTTKYSIQLDLGVQPGANATKRTQWRIDNFVVYS